VKRNESYEIASGLHRDFLKKIGDLGASCWFPRLEEIVYHLTLRCLMPGCGEFFELLSHANVLFAFNSWELNSWLVKEQELFPSQSCVQTASVVKPGCSGLSPLES